MVKKGIKRKTRWRTLSMGDGATDDASDTGFSEQLKGIGAENKENHIVPNNTVRTRHLSTDTIVKHSPQYTKTTQLSRSSHQQRPNYRYSDKVPLSSSSSTSRYSSGTPFSASLKRRTSYQSTSSRYKSNPVFGDRSYTTKSTVDSNNCDKDANTTKPLFNEDEYTRITTPRQDVLFKKGYLSRPKKVPTPSSTATTTTTSSSGAVSVTSNEESMSTSTQSITPEHCNSTPELNDHPFMYPGFFDQNGVFFVNPFLSNGFDPYGGQLIMMPYDGPPYSINPTEYYNNNNPDCMQPPSSQSSSSSSSLQHDRKRNSIDSQNAPTTQSSSDDPSCNSSASSPPITEQSDNAGDVHSDTPSVSKGDDENNTEIISDHPSEFLPEHCHPQFFYPFMFGPPPQFLPPNGYQDYSNGYGSMNNKFSRFKKRKKPTYKYSNSTGVSATTTDYSEDDDSTDNERYKVKTIPNSDDGYESNITPINQEDLLARTTLNTNVDEFIPRRLQPTIFNVEVEEFHPRNYTQLNGISEEEKPTPADIISNETLTECPSANDVQPSTEDDVIKPTSICENKTTASQPSSATKFKSNRIKDKCMPTCSDSSKISTAAARKIDEVENVQNIIDEKCVKADRIVSKENNIQSYKNKEKIVAPSKKATNNFKKNEKQLQKAPVDQSTNNGNDAKALTNNTLIKLDSATTTKTTTTPTNTINNNNNNNNNNSISESKIKLNEKTSKTDGKQKVMKEKDKETDSGQIKINQLTYAQMVGPAKSSKPSPEKKVKKITNTAETQQELIDLNKAIEESKKITDNKVITWQTVKTKGRRKLQQVQLEENEDFWNEPEPPEPTHAACEITISTDAESVSHVCINEKSNEATDLLTTENTTLTNDLNEIVDDVKTMADNELSTTEDNNLSQTTTTTTSSGKKSKQEKNKKPKSKPKAAAVATTTKKATKEMSSNQIDSILFNHTNSSQRSCSTPKKTESSVPSTAATAATTISKTATRNTKIDYIDTIINNVDISQLCFKPTKTTNPMFINPISCGMFLNKDSGMSSGAGFGLNSPLSMMNKYDFGKAKECVLLKEEEEMVMRVMKSLNEKEKLEKTKSTNDDSLNNPTATDTNSTATDVLNGDSFIENNADADKNVNESVKADLNNEVNKINEKNASDDQTATAVAVTTTTTKPSTNGEMDEEEIFFKIVQEMNLKFIDNKTSTTKKSINAIDMFINNNNMNGASDLLQCNGRTKNIMLDKTRFSADATEIPSIQTWESCSSK